VKEKHKVKKIVHISPTVPPSINGLGDFCTILAEGLNSLQTFNNIFLICENNYDNSGKTNIKKFNRRNFFTELVQIKPEIIILHYVGYAYHSKGLPFYLVNQLANITETIQCKLIIFFHELSSSSRNPLTLPFYTSFLQKRIVRELSKSASATFTNCTVYSRELIKLTSTQNNICTGIFSNIPDLLYQEEYKKDDRSIVVFGTIKNREAVYNNPLFKNVLQRLRIIKIFDIGPGKINFRYPGIEFLPKGSLIPEDVALYLNMSTFGAIDYPSSLLGKSGIFAAYAAFGIISINFNNSDKSLHDDLVKEKNYFDCETNFSSFNLQIIRREIRNWYEKRSSETITKTIFNYI